MDKDGVEQTAGVWGNGVGDWNKTTWVGEWSKTMCGSVTWIRGRIGIEIPIYAYCN